MRAAPNSNPPESTTVLGDWYANLLYINRRQIILCVSERTLLPVLLPAADAKTLPRRLPAAVAEVLAAASVDSLVARDHELREMSQVCLATTADRRVLGSMNDFAFSAQVPLDHGESLLATSVFLADMPCSPIGMDSPRRATVAAFARASMH